MIVIPKDNNDIKGIIRSNRRIKVNADAKYVSGRHPNNVFNDELSDKCWYGAPRNDQNITITFKNVKIIPSNYSIQSASRNCSNYFPRKWTLHGYRGSQWDLLSSVTNSGLTTHSQTKVYSVELQMYSYNIFKFTNIGPCYTSADIPGTGFILQALDFFGAVIMKQNSCMQARYRSINNHIMLLVLISSY